MPFSKGWQWRNSENTFNNKILKTSSPEVLGKFQTNMAQSIFLWREFKFVQMKGHVRWWWSMENLLLKSKGGGHIFFVLYVILSSSLKLKPSMLITFEQWVLELWYFLWWDLSVGTIIFYFVTLTLAFDPFFETLTLLMNFEQWVLELWYFTWLIPCDRTFLWVSFSFTLWPWPWSLTYFLKT